MSDMALHRLLGPVMRGIHLLFGRGVLTKDGRCIITCKTLEVFAEKEAVFDTPKARFTGDVNIEKNLTVKQNMSIEGSSESKGTFTAPEAVIGGVKQTAHRHHENGQGSLTGGPQ